MAQTMPRYLLDTPTRSSQNGGGKAAWMVG
jgi:hypothetical protein